MMIGLMKNMKIAIITHEYPHIEGERACIARNCIRCTKKWLKYRGLGTKRCKHSDSFKVHRMPQKGSQDRICSLRLAKYIKKNSHVIEYLHFADPGALKALLRLGYFLKNIPSFIITIHGSELLLFTRNPLEKYLFRSALKKRKIHVLPIIIKMFEGLFPEISEKVFKIPGAPEEECSPALIQEQAKFSNSINRKNLFYFVLVEFTSKGTA